MNDYEARQEARRERLLDAADKADRESQQRYDQARTMSAAIPFGQPMMPDHHSYRRDRNYRDRIHQNYGKAFAAADKAKELRAKAEAVGSAGISIDDPDAGAKLAAKIAKLERDQERMKAANAAIRKHKKAGAEAQVAALVALGFEAGVSEKLLRPDFCGRVGFPDYALQNNNANIRRLKSRVNQVAAVQAAPEVAKQVGAVQYREEDGRVWLVFPGKPADEVRAELRSHGFKWSPTRGAWVRHLSNAARYHGQQIAAKVGGAL